MYGYINDKNYKLFPTVNLYAPILQIREPNIGETVGYDATYKITKKSTLGILGLGYADGLKRCIGSRNRLSLGEFNIEEKTISWDNSDQLEIKPNHKINKPEILFEKIEDKTISEQKEKLK